MNIALLLAAGKGTRITSDVPKQFLEVNNKPIFMYSLETFTKHPEIDAIVLVTSEDYKKHVENLCSGFPKVKGVVIGGDTRQESVSNGLNFIKQFAQNNDIVLIHDTARPLVSSKIISENIKEASKFDAVTTAIPASDTIIESQSLNQIDSYQDRNHIFNLQTPQSFKFSLLLKAHAEVKEVFTDDSALVVELGKPVYIVKGSKYNFKITTDEDLELFKATVNK